jgi:hypothetical protein
MSPAYMKLEGMRVAGMDAEDMTAGGTWTGSSQRRQQWRQTQVTYGMLRRLMRLRILGGLGVIWLAGGPLRRRMLARLVVVVQLGSAHLARRILSLLVGIILPRAIGIVGIVGVRRIAGHLCVKE